MTSSEYGEHFEKWSAELAGDVPTTTATDPDEAPVPVDSPEAQRERPRVRDGERRPVVPAWAKSKAGIAAEVKRVVSLGLHVVEYHALRVPVYAARLTLRAPRGVKLWWRELADWVNDAEGRPLRAATAAREDYEAYRKLVLIRDRHVRWRGMVVTASAAAVAIAGSVLYATGQMAEPPAWSETARSWPVWLAAAAAGLAAAGWKGRPEDKPLLEAAVVKTSLAPLTSDVVIRGLSVLGISGISQALAKDPNAIGFVSPIARDGNGWRAEVDLPYGVTVGEVADRRDKLASGLGRPLGCVWPEGNADVHPGRLVVWVGDEDMARAKQPAWPLLRKGKVNLFEAFELGTDPRGRTVWLTLMFASMVIGAIPRMGKTFALRLILLACALDPRCELHVFNLKGGSDFAPLQPVSHAWRTGDRDDDIEYLVADLRKLHADMQRRYQVIEELPRELCPESKVTDELASKKSLGLHPVVVALDECQRGFEHKEHGVEIEEICEDLVRRGPAVGIMAICATQRPDKDSLPKGISANAALRFCLKVTGQVENDMVLGTSAYKNGVRATMFSRR
ncbi:MAG: cell division protein FtsK, partial [Stackebrandtia sp.]